MDYSFVTREVGKLIAIQTPLSAISSAWCEMLLGESLRGCEAAWNFVSETLRGWYAGGWKVAFASFQLWDVGLIHFSVTCVSGKRGRHTSSLLEFSLGLEVKCDNQSCVLHVTMPGTGADRLGGSGPAEAAASPPGPAAPSPQPQSARAEACCWEVSPDSMGGCFGKISTMGNYLAFSKQI